MKKLLLLKLSFMTGRCVSVREDLVVIGRITEESMEFLLEEIVDAVENTGDRDTQFEMVKQILLDNGIVEMIPD